jgi:hypothetical protein
MHGVLPFFLCFYCETQPDPIHSQQMWPRPRTVKTNKSVHNWIPGKIQSCVVGPTHLSNCVYILLCSRLPRTLKTSYKNVHKIEFQEGKKNSILCWSCAWSCMGTFCVQAFVWIKIRSCCSIQKCYFTFCLSMFGCERLQLEMCFLQLCCCRFCQFHVRRRRKRRRRRWRRRWWWW